MGTPLAYSHDQIHQHHANMPPAGVTFNPIPGASYQYGTLSPLRTQVEFYFSPQNLAKDTYLLSYLKSSYHLGVVPMSVICNFPKVKQIYAFLNNMGHLPLHLIPMADPALVRMAIYQSSVVAVSHDGAWLSPMDRAWMNQEQKQPPPQQQQRESSEGSHADSNGSNTSEGHGERSAPSSPSSHATATSSLGVPTHPLPPAAADSADITRSTGSNRGERNVVILRDIPATVAAEEVLNTLQLDNITPKAARPDVGNTWYVTFESEEQALKALAGSREAIVAGIPVRGYLKSDKRTQPATVASSTRSSERISSVGASSVASNGASTTKENSSVNTGIPPHEAIPVPPGHPGQAYAVGLPTVGYAFPMQQQGMFHQSPYGGYIAYGTPNMRVHTYQNYRPGNAGYPSRPMNNYQRNFPARARPPPHVYLRPEGPNERGGNEYSKDTNGRDSKNSSNGRNDNRGSSNNSNSAGKRSQNSLTKWQPTKNSKDPGNSTSSQPESKHRQSQTAAKSSKGSRNTKEHRSNSYNNNETKTSKKDKRQDPQKSMDINLGAEHFPALGGGTVPTSNSGPKETVSLPTTGGYAQALLKKPEKAKASVSSPTTVSAEPSEIALCAEMSKIAFSEEAVAKVSSDEW